MDGARTVPVALLLDESYTAPRRNSVFRNILSVSLAPRVSDARPQENQQQGSRSSLLRSVRGMAVVAPLSPDTSGELRPAHASRGSQTLQSVEEDSDKPAETPIKREAFFTPVPLSLRQPSRVVVKSLTMFGYSLAPLYDLWERLQVSHCGQYSVERMLALDEYCRRTSLSRVMAVCFLTPTIPLLVVILMELVPLTRGENGATANYVFWARHAFIIALTVMCAEIQATSWIPELPLTTKQALVIAVGTAIFTIGVELPVAHLWVFPIPFLSVLGAPLLLLFWLVMTRIVLGPNPVQGVQDAAFRGRRFCQIILLQMSLLLIYPAYQALFIAVDSVVQVWIVSLLPLINVGLKNTLVACGSHLEDNLPELVVLTVDGFSALYSVICLRGTNSLTMVAVTVSLNVVVMTLSLHGMNRRSRAARASRIFHLMQMRQRRALLTPSFQSSSSPGGGPELFSTLVLTTLTLLRAPGQLDPSELREIRLLSGMQHKLSEANSTLLQSLAARCVYNNDRRMSKAISIGQMKSRFASATIEGRVLSATHFSVPVPSPSQLAQRIRAAIRTLPVVGSQIKGTVGNEMESFHSSNRDKTSSNGAEVDSRAASSHVSRIAKLVEAWISDRTASPNVPLSSPNTPLSMVGLDLDTSSKLRSLVMTGSPVISDVLVETRKTNTRAVKQSLQLLFNNEYLGLIAYVQCVIPVLYVLYMPILQMLPNRVYYPAHFVLMEEADQFIDRMKMISILALLQFANLIVLHVFVAMRFAVSTIYQIAFVLETHIRLVEGRLIVWFIFAVQSTLMHYGADFSFQFNWVNDETVSTDKRT